MSLYRAQSDDLTWDAGCNQYVWGTQSGWYRPYSNSILTHTCPTGQIAYFKIPARDHHELL